MNTKAMISLDELVNKPDLIIQKLEKYGELVLIWNNEPYCVVSRVSSEEDDCKDVNPVSLVREDKPLPIASSRFAEQTKRENEPVVPLRPDSDRGGEFSSADSWFASDSFRSEPGLYQGDYEDASSYEEPSFTERERTLSTPLQAEKTSPTLSEEKKEEKPTMTNGFSFVSGFLPLQRSKKPAPKPQESGKQESAPSLPASADLSPSLSDPQSPDEPESSQKSSFDYVPYEVLKRQHSNLWDIMAKVLSEHPQHTMHAVDLARVINERGLYKTRDGSPVTPVQIRARVSHRPDRFAALGGNMIKLLDPKG